MASNWTTYKVGDLFYLQNGFAFKGTDFIDEGIPVIKIKNVKAGKILLNDLSYVSREVADKAKRFFIKPNDILITMSGNRMDGSPETWVGKVALFQEEGEFLLNQRVGILRPKEGIDVSVNYCAYALSSWEYQNQFINIANSSGGQANISPTQILDTNIILPDKETQIENAEILSLLDDKIQLNEEVSKISDDIASTIFSEWFLNSRKPNLNGINHFGQFKIGDIGNVVTGKTPSSSNPEQFGQDILFVTPTDFKSYNKIIIDSERKLSEQGANFFKNKILPKNSIIVTCIGSDMGKVAMNRIECVTNQQINSVVVDETLAKPDYVYYFMKSIYSLLKNMATAGSTMPIVNKSQFEQIEIPLPNIEIQSQFQEICDSVNDTIENNLRETKKLEILKQTLLPILIKQDSGIGIG